MRKLLFISGLFLILLGGAFTTSPSASAKSLPKLSTQKVTYASSALNVQVKVPKSASLLAVVYNHHTSYCKLKKNTCNLNYKFTGYKTFELYGTTSKHQRVTQIKKLSRSAYATNEIVNFSEVRTKSDAQVIVNTLGSHRTVRLYSGKKLLSSQNTGSGQHVSFRLTLKQYKPTLTYTVTATNKKASGAFFIPYLEEPSNLEGIA